MSVSVVKKAAEDIKALEKEAVKVNVKLKVLLSKVTGFEQERKSTSVKWAQVTNSVAEKLARVEEYVAKYGATVREEAIAAQIPSA